MKNYYRIMLGKQSAYAQECFADSYIGADFGIAQDLTVSLEQQIAACIVGVRVEAENE